MEKYNGQLQNLIKNDRSFRLFLSELKLLHIDFYEHKRKKKSSGINDIGSRDR